MSASYLLKKTELQSFLGSYVKMFKKRNKSNILLPLPKDPTAGLLKASGFSVFHLGLAIMYMMITPGQ